jgi:hypothetical protein
LRPIRWTLTGVALLALFLIGVAILDNERVLPAPLVFFGRILILPWYFVGILGMQFVANVLFGAVHGVPRWFAANTTFLRSQRSPRSTWRARSSDAFVGTRDRQVLTSE